MVDTSIKPASPRPNLRPIGWFMASSGVVIAVVALVMLASLGGWDPLHRIGRPMLFMIVGFAGLGALSVVNGIVTIRTNRRSAAMRNATLALFVLVLAGLVFAGRRG